MQVTVIISLVAALTLIGCQPQKNSFESCVEFARTDAKRLMDKIKHLPEYADPKIYNDVLEDETYKRVYSLCKVT